jgi:hypothetical protein
LLRDLTRASDPALQSIAQSLDQLNADVLVLDGLDYDAENAALQALNASLAHPYPHALALRPNTGIPTGQDLDGNGRSDEARDAIGYGRFPGANGMAILSRLPIAESRDFNAFLWRDLPGTLMPPDQPATLPLSTTGHHDTTITTPTGPLHLLTWHASTPALDGPEDRNGRRNHDETAFWLALLNRALPFPPPPAPFVLIGQANLDPAKGEGRHAILQTLLQDRRLQDPLSGDTVDYAGTIGRLRTDYILPSADLNVLASGLQPAIPASRHRALWVQLAN